MSCLALALQPVNNGPDLLLHTREWFPPARALLVSSNFRAVRKDHQAKGKLDGSDPGLGDEALAAAGGQVVVGNESKYRVIYRLVNSIYVVGMSCVYHDDVASSNVFECTAMVNQAVSVLVAACKGVEVTLDKLNRKYTEIYMALDVILRGVSTARLATILATIHGEGIAQMVMSVTDAENRARGAESWNQVKGHSSEHLANIEILSNTTFELPEETLAAGDEVTTTMAPAAQLRATQTSEHHPAEKSSESEDPFSASDKISRRDELAGEFKKSKATVPPDVTTALAELEVPTMAPSTTAESMFIGIEGFEGDYGGLDFGEDGAMFGGALEGFNDVFGGGLDASEFGATSEGIISKGLGGLEELEELERTETAPKSATVLGIANAKVPTGNVEKVLESKLPFLYLTEEIHAEFKGSKLVRIGLQGALHLRTLPPRERSGQDTAFSFRLEGSAGIKKAVMRNAVVSSLGKGLFHVRTPPVEESLPILKYRLHPRFTPVPLRIRFVTLQTGSLLSLMIQYVANPYLPGTLRDVSFIVRLPSVPSLLKMSPKGLMNRHSKELRWQVNEIQLQASPGRLRAQMPLDVEGGDASVSRPVKMKLQACVEFSFIGQTLSGICIVPTTGTSTDFYVGEHTYKTGNYFCS